MDAPDVTQLPQTGSVQAPDSGTYGVKAANDRLAQNLQPAQAPGPGGPGGPPPAPPVSTLPASAKSAPSTGPFGLPAAITAPTQQPNVPVGTPLAQAVNPVAQAGNGMQKRMAFLDMLARDPDVSDTTRQFAQTLIAKLIAASKQ
jgi:hypothetical protein